MSIPLCKHCKHAVPSADGIASRALCEHPNNYVDVPGKINPVTGDPVAAMRVARAPGCADQRQERDPHTLKLVCGPSGRWFEPK